MVSPKDARRRKQLLARERKAKKARKALAKKRVDRRAPSFEALVERWQAEELQSPVEESCPGCAGRLVVEAHGDGGMMFHHPGPWCAAYEAFSATLDESPHGPADDDDDDDRGISMDTVMRRMIPGWTHGPATEISEEEGEALMASGKVLPGQYHELRSGMFQGVAHARTAEGLFRWPLKQEDDADYTEEDELEDEEFDVRRLAREIFGNKEAADEWLETSNEALEGNAAPIDLFDSLEGIDSVRALLEKMKGGDARAS